MTLIELITTFVKSGDTYAFTLTSDGNESVSVELYGDPQMIALYSILQCFDLGATREHIDQMADVAQALNSIQKTRGGDYEPESSGRAK